MPMMVLISEGSGMYPKPGFWVSGTRNLIPGFWKCHGEMDLWQVEQGFSSFVAKRLVYLMIFSRACRK